MTLLEVATELRDLCAQVQRLNVEVEHAARLQRRVADCTEAVDKLAEAAAVRAALRELQVHTAAPADDIDRVGRMIDTLERELDTGPAPDQAFTHAAAATRALANKTREQLLPNWTEWTQAQLDGLGLSRIALLPPAARARLAAVADRLSTRATTPPASRSEVDAFARGLEELREGIAEVRLSAASPETAEFLERCASPRGASLADLTPTVAAELNQAGLTDRLCVRWSPA